MLMEMRKCFHNLARALFLCILSSHVADVYRSRSSLTSKIATIYPALLIRIQSLVDYDSNEALNIETWRTSPIEDPQIRKSVNPLSPDAMGFPNLGRLLHELSSFLAPETFRISPKIEAFVSSGVASLLLVFSLSANPWTSRNTWECHQSRRSSMDHGSNRFFDCSALIYRLQGLVL
jgi:hypothetical protein